MVTTQETSAPLPEENRYFYLSSPDGTACRISFTGNHGWRIQSQKDGAYEDTGAAQLLSIMLDEDDPSELGRIDAAETDGKTTVKAEDGSTMHYTAAPFSLDFYTANGTLAAHITDICLTEGGAKISGEIQSEESIFGTGERFNSCDQRGKLLDIYARDLWNNCEGNSYIPIPLLLFSRGSGLYMNRYERMTADLGHADSNLWSIETLASPIDLYVFATEKPSDVLYGYSSLTGFAQMPQDWNFGYLICRKNPEFSDRASVMEMVKQMEEHDLPWTGVIFEAWDISYPARYPELRGIIDDLHAMGKKVLTYCPTGQVNLNRLGVPDMSYLVRNTDGYWKFPVYNGQNPDSSHYSTTWMDISNREAAEWFYGEIWGEIVYDGGFDGSKIDFCELFTDTGLELQLGDGYPTYGSHHWYPTLFATKLARQFRDQPNGFMIFTRGGGIGTHRVACILLGDQTRNFSRLPWQLTAILSSGLSGLPFSTPDLGGYFDDPNISETEEARIFTRGTEMCCFTVLMETHGGADVARPYDFPDETVDMFRAYLNLHNALIPYISEMARISTETAMPVARHMFLMYPDDKTATSLSDQYMFGDALLVAPVLNDTPKRSVYLPEGSWKNIFTGETYTAGEDGLWLRDIDVPLTSIPVYLNLNHNSETIEAALADAAEWIETINNLSR